MKQGPRVFISYARSDGEAFARALRERLLREEPGLTLWQDRTDLEGGIGWWRQITEALDTVEFMVLVMTPGALQSSTVRKEWLHARQHGVCVYPVKGVPGLDFAALPRWMRDVHFFDLTHEWDGFIQHLKAPARVARVPFMAPDLPDAFVARPTEFEALIGHLLDRDRQNPVMITTTLHGAGGFGKTTLAAALCHHPDVSTAFSDGILWVTLGERPDVREGLMKLYAALTGERPDFVDAEDAVVHLTELLTGKNCLLVIDDAWDGADLGPFLRAAHTCATLITTRNFEVAGGTISVNVDEMTGSEAVQLLAAKLGVSSPERELRELARRLGEWPLLLELAGSALRQRLARGDSVAGALGYVTQALNRRGIIAFDHRNTRHRTQAAATTIEVSLQLLDPQERRRYLELAIFPEDVEVPLMVVQALWGLDPFDVEELVQRLGDLSLLRFNLQVGTLRLHDVMRSYSGQQLEDAPALHARLVDAWGDVHRLPEAYAWRWLAYHLAAAGRHELLRTLLHDFRWVSSKLEAADPGALISDYDWLDDDTDARTIQGALRLAAHLLGQDRSQLAAQLIGRLQAPENGGIRQLLDQARNGPSAPWLRPLAPSLTPPGGRLVRTLVGHVGAVSTVSVTADGRRAVSGDDEGAIKVWDVERGVEERALPGHRDCVRALAVDGRWAASSSDDGSLRVWDVERGLEVRCLVDRDDDLRRLLGDGGDDVASRSMTANPQRARSGLVEIVTAVALTEDGRTVVSGSSEGIVTRWNVDTGAVAWTRVAHEDTITSLAISADGARVISGSADGSLRVSDLAQGHQVAALSDGLPGIVIVKAATDDRWLVVRPRERKITAWDPVGRADELTVPSHAEGLRGVSADARRAISALRDGSLRLWDLERGIEAGPLIGHTDWVRSVALTPDGRRAISGSDDRTLKVWDLERDRESRSQHGHSDGVTALSMTKDGGRAISASRDGTLKIWDVEHGQVIRTLTAHRNRAINAIATTPDGRRAVAASRGGILVAWDVDRGTEISVLAGHTSSVRDVSITADGSRAVSVSGDGTLRVWDLDSGKPIHILTGHRHVVTGVAISADGRRAISTSRDSTLRVWDLERGHELGRLIGHHQEVTRVALATDARYAISVADDGWVKLWDVEQVAESRTLGRHSTGITALAATPDLRWAVSASRDGVTRVWDILRGEEHGSLTGHVRGVTALAVTPDGQHVVSACEDGCLRLWGTAPCALVSSFHSDAWLTACAITVDGSTIVAGDWLGGTHFLRLER